MSSELIRTSFERNATAVKRRPGIGQRTATTRVRLRDGLCCEVEEGDWRLTVDMSEKSGGGNAGPNPGILGRGALGSCLAMGYVMWAAKLGVHLAAVEVEVQADYDARGTYGVADVPAGYLEVRYLVTIESDAGEDEILRVLDESDAHSPYLDVFGRAQDIRREVRIVATRR